MAFDDLPQQNPALDESLYGLDTDEAAFFKQQTGIQDDDELKKHLLQIQADAYAVFPYPCIRIFHWTKLKISRLFPYPRLLNLGRDRKDAIFLDIGCCFGNDVRKVIADGYPVQNVVASDLHPEFWEIGHKLFRTTDTTYPVAFVPGDAFAPSHLDVVPPFTLASPPTSPKPSLNTLTSLNPLHGYVSAIHASAFFHLFEEAEQLHLARALSGLLSPEPGSMIFGQHVALPEKGLRKSWLTGRSTFEHSPESWKEMWEGIFREVGAEVEVDARLSRVGEGELQRTGSGTPVTRELWWMEWVVTRV
ncbi:hypothetical protein BV25DRAFT_1820395 [Artomyces pyxidatus]|uniref:Uncharacterized protein n=1 Tax=Artomyces pyxidatus TaxID=48021 RepID=A0ACB8TD05_9AGAM|nr:hypothetical protein BV25DRAFT_1820395 [Artomyces pyxidatus]